MTSGSIGTGTTNSGSTVDNNGGGGSDNGASNGSGSGTRDKAVAMIMGKAMMGVEIKEVLKTKQWLILIINNNLTNERTLSISYSLYYIVRRRQKEHSSLQSLKSKPYSDKCISRMQTPLDLKWV